MNNSFPKKYPNFFLQCKNEFFLKNLKDNKSNFKRHSLKCHSLIVCVGDTSDSDESQIQTIEEIYDSNEYQINYKPPLSTLTNKNIEGLTILSNLNTGTKTYKNYILLIDLLDKNIDKKTLLNTIYKVFKKAFQQNAKSKELTSFFVLHLEKPEIHHLKIFFSYNTNVSVKETKFKKLLENALHPQFENVKILMVTAGFNQKNFIKEIISTLIERFVFLDIPETKKL